MGSAKRVAHDWNPWTESAFYGSRVQVCRRCAEMVFDLTGEGATFSMQAAAAAVRASIESADAASLRSTVLTHRGVLLGPVTERYLLYAADQLSPTGEVRKTYQDFASALTRCRLEGIDAVFGSPAPASSSEGGAGHAAGHLRTDGPRAQPLVPDASGPLDAALVGHWRHNEPVSGFPTDTHCLFDDAGHFKWWSKSVTPFGVRDSDAEYGTWHVANGLLHLRFEDGTHWQRRHLADSANMVWQNDNRYRFWTRLR